MNKKKTWPAHEVSFFSTTWFLTLVGLWEKNFFASGRKKKQQKMLRTRHGANAVIETENRKKTTHKLTGK